MDIKFTDMDIVDANISFSREYLTKAKSIKDNDRMLKLLLLAQQSLKNAINQLDNQSHVKKQSKVGNIKQKE